MRSAAKRKIDRPGSIAATVAASAAALPEAEVGPKVRPLDLNSVRTLMGRPAWDSIGIYARLAYAALRASEEGDVDLGQAAADLMAQEDGTPFEDTLVMMGNTRIALIEIAAMMKESLTKQWKAIDAYLVAEGHAPLGLNDELCDDAELLVLRPAFEAGRAAMAAATAEVAAAEAQCKPKSARREAAYAAQAAAIDRDNALVDQVAALRAHTKQGIRFKREVRAYWQDCEQLDLDRSINADLLAYVEASP